eukprot:COSAG04_NODE_691_length_11104_cov_6.949841_17_plen_83_part_01
MQRKAAERARGVDLHADAEMEGVATKIQARHRGRQSRRQIQFPRARPGSRERQAEDDRFGAQLAAFRSTAASEEGSHRIHFAD